MSLMTDEQADKILGGTGTKSGLNLTELFWGDRCNSVPYVNLNGNYTRQELLAILHFHPKE
ncbi:hypothetical protein [Ralstonia phage RP31]|uniref:Uncharacterized protein n=2 Tax=Ripduovirus RP12 TaxID=2560700 RepID=A0A1L7N0X4_9CAUD|nr:hypothetical protein FDH28_gp275 [Ralstonia phage RP12]BAW19120.1 hypothetical protein [Ralstonia phage RP12]BAW19406.1 hypothetical protein [Ralstonia phage RP31]